jgi:hypothetical protein
LEKPASKSLCTYIENFIQSVTAQTSWFIPCDPNNREPECLFRFL